jgi:hypothetical protein
MPALPSSLISSLISSLSPAPPGASVVASAAGLLTALGSLPDPRARRGVRHALVTVVAAAVCAVVAGYRSYTAIGESLIYPLIPQLCSESTLAGGRQRP